MSGALNLERTDWHQTPEEREKSARIVAQLEAAIVAAPKPGAYSGEERRKVARLTRRENLARCLVTLNQALAALAKSGTLDDSARVWISEGFDVPTILEYGGYYDVNGKAQMRRVS
jgi:hypothetical protein